MGQATTNGIAHDIEIQVPKIRSANPRPATLHQVMTQTSLRTEVQRARPREYTYSTYPISYNIYNFIVIQARQFAFMEGFLPHVAKELQVAIFINYTEYYSAHFYLQKVAIKAGLLNRYGAPDAASFAAFGYCAALHFDRDDTWSAAWIAERSEKVGDQAQISYYATNNK